MPSSLVASVIFNTAGVRDDGYRGTTLVEVELYHDQSTIRGSVQTFRDFIYPQSVDSRRREARGQVKNEELVPTYLLHWASELSSMGCPPLPTLTLGQKLVYQGFILRDDNDNIVVTHHGQT
ncbi:hypothetical protein PG984_000989 [Apiospora sp. TS-2023a]